MTEGMETIATLPRFMVGKFLFGKKFWSEPIIEPSAHFSAPVAFSMITDTMPEAGSGWIGNTGKPFLMITKKTQLYQGGVNWNQSTGTSILETLGNHPFRCNVETRDLVHNTEIRN